MKKNNQLIIILLTLGVISMATIRISKAGINTIKEHEALRLKPYLDSANKLTIGWGHLILPEETYLTDPGGITELKAEQLLVKDLTIAESAVNAYVTSALTGNQYDALVSFVYNIGTGAFKKSTMLRKINAGDYEGAAAEFPRWKIAGGKESAGLLARRAKEQSLFIG